MEGQKDSLEMPNKTSRKGNEAMMLRQKWQWVLGLSRKLSGCSQMQSSWPWKCSPLMTRSALNILAWKAPQRLSTKTRKTAT